MWELHNTAVLSALHGSALVLSGDARCDSPGHCASMGTYSLLDDASGLIIAQETIHVTEVANSYSRTPLIRPPTESHWCGRIRGVLL